MLYNVHDIDQNYSFDITGVSFIGAPIDSTMLFVTKKVKNLLTNISGKKNCLVFVENGIDVPDEYKADNCFVLCDDPQYEYALVSKQIYDKQQLSERSRKYTLTEGGYYLGENVSIGANTVIEHGCTIDHDVVIGDNCYIGIGSVIRNTVIGNNFSCHENCTIGTESFFFAEDKDGTGFRIPSFGKIIIEDNVDIGAGVIIERGFNSNTYLCHHVSLDSGVSIGHDNIIGAHVSIMAGATLAGFVTVGERSFIGLGASIKQRLSIGDNSTVCMGAVVISNVKSGISVIGNPAAKFM